MTWRRLGVLFDALPGESATKTAMRDSIPDEELARRSTDPPPGHGPWTAERLDLAALRDTVNLILWRIMQVTSQDGTTIGAPEPVRRPGLTTKPRRKVTDEGRQYLQYLRQNRGAIPPGYTTVQAR